MSTSIPDLDWSKEKKQFPTQKGMSPLGFIAPGNEQWWAYYRANKDKARELGLMCLPDTQGRWWVINKGVVEPTKAQEFLAASKAQDADIVIPSNEGCTYLGYQKAGIAYARTHQNVLFGDEMGLGKTIQAIGVMNDDRTLQRVLIVCPAFLKLNWRAEFEKWYVGKRRVHIINSGDKLPDPEVETDRAQVTIINYEILQKYVEKMPIYDAMILDECHYIKSDSAKRTKAVQGVRARRTMALTGTPMLNRPAELFTVLKMLCPQEFGNKYQFMHRYCDMKDNGWGLEAKGCTNAAELQRRLRTNCMVRRLKMDVLKELPAKRRQTIPLPPTQEIRMLLNEELKKWEVHEEVLSDLKARRDMAEITQEREEYKAACSLIAKEISIAFTEMALIRKRLSELKVPLVEDHVNGLLESVDKAIVFWHHKGAAAMFRDMMKEHSPIFITGDVPADERMGLVKRFQEDKDVRLCVGTIGAMGVGLTLTAASTVVFGELDWRPGILAQAEDRAHRIGQHDTVLCQYLIFEDSLDAKMLLAVLEKMENTYRVLDEENGVDEEPTTSQAQKREPRPLVNWTELGNKLTEEQRDTVVECMRFLAFEDKDKARVKNGKGFSKFDSRIGQELAGRSAMTLGELAFGRNLLRKYHAQLTHDQCKILQFDVGKKDC